MALPATLADMITDRDLATVAPHDTVRKACIVMSSANVGALPVLDENGFLIGMISERDVIKRSVIVYRPSKETAVSQVMTSDPKWLAPDATPEDAIDMMRNGRFRHLPICLDGFLVGIVSIRDFLIKTGNEAAPPLRQAQLGS